jgi:SecD/SecF fusion protein
VTRNVERDAENFAKETWRKKSYLDSMAGEVVYNLGFAKYTYQEAKQMNSLWDWI